MHAILCKWIWQKGEPFNKRGYIFPTFKTVGVVAWVLVRKSCLVGECVDDLDPDLTASTVGPRGCYGVADAAVQQPAWTALVKPLFPGRVQLSSCGQSGVEFLTVLHSLLIGEAVVVTGEEDFAWEKHLKEFKRVQAERLIDIWVYVNCDKSSPCRRST